MNLEFALQNPKVWILAAVAGVIGMLVHRDGIRWWSFVRYAVLVFLVKIAMPLSFNKTDTHVYFVYGLVFGAIAGALHAKAKTTTSRSDGQPEIAQSTSIRERLGGAALGAALGVVVNIVITMMTYV